MIVKRSYFLISSISVFSLYFLWRYWRKKKNERSDKIKITSVVVVSNHLEWDEAFKTLQHNLQTVKVLGFDCEWVTRDRHRQPVSLLQLATASGFCLLIRLCRFKGQLPQELISLLCDSTILKVGVACLDDAQKLLADHGISVRGCVDLRHLAMRSRVTNTTSLSLKGLAQSVLGVTMTKENSVRCGDWEADELNNDQSTYGALDALASVQIFFSLLELRRLDRENNSAGSHAPKQRLELSDWSQLAVMSRCQGLIDSPFTHVASPNKNQSTKVDSSKDSKNKITTDAAVDDKPHRAYVVRKTPLYHNCQLRSPDDQLLCTCDVRKATWYLERGLGEKVSDEPLVVRLKFEPAGRPLDEQNYYLQEKDNVCVVCGRDDSYIRKCIIPHEYRKHFPAVMKEHKSHDVLLLCTTCHRLSNSHDSRLKQLLTRRLAAESSAAESIQTAADDNSANKITEEEHYLTSVRSAAKALLSDQRQRIPESRLQELEQLVGNYFGVPEVTPEILNEALNLKIRCRRDVSSDHGRRVVDHVIQREGLVEFERMWRRHFLDTMAPRHMPALWNVEHSHDELNSMSEAFQQALPSNT